MIVLEQSRIGCQTWYGEGAAGSEHATLGGHPAEQAITATHRYISLLPVIPVTLHLNSQEALEGRHPQDGRSAWAPPEPLPAGLWEAGPKGPGGTQTHGDVTLYK